MKNLTYRTVYDGCEDLLPLTENTLRGLPLYADIKANLLELNGVTVGVNGKGETKCVIYHNTMEYTLVYNSPDVKVERIPMLPDFNCGGYATMIYKGGAPEKVTGVFSAQNLDGITQCVNLAFSDEDNPDETEAALYKLVKRTVCDTADIFCIVEDGTVVSTAMIVAKNKKYAVIGNIFTLEDRRCNGYAGRLLNACVDRALKENLIPALYCEYDLVPYYSERGFETTDVTL